MVFLAFTTFNYLKPSLLITRILLKSPSEISFSFPPCPPKQIRSAESLQNQAELQLKETTESLAEQISLKDQEFHDFKQNTQSQHLKLTEIHNTQYKKLTEKISQIEEEKKKTKSPN